MSEMAARNCRRKSNFDEELNMCPGRAVYLGGPYSRSGKYVKQGKIVYYKKQGVSRVSAKNRDVRLKAKGPNTLSAVEINESGFKMKTQTELVSVSAKVDNVKLKAKGPNTLSAVKINESGFKMKTQTELVSVSAKVDNVKLKVKGLNTSAAVHSGQDGAEVTAQLKYASASAKVGVVEAEANGPNASAGAKVGKDGAAVMTRAELCSVSAKAGSAGMKVGLSVDTGASVGRDGLEAKFLGTGITIGRKTSVSFGGCELSWAF